jgi:integrase
MVEIDTAMIRRYIAKRQTDRIIVRKARTIRHRDGSREELPEITKPVSNAEINRELQILKRCFNLARKEGRLLHTPHVPMLREDNVRKGFLDTPQLQATLAFLPAELQAVVRFAYITGWRVASEILPLEWSRVDFQAREVRLDPGTTKNREGRIFPMNADLRALLIGQRQVTDGVQRERGRIVRFVFHRNGEPIRSLSKAWKTACAKAGIPGRILHDMRRSAVRNMVRSGISETVAMKLSGHQTRSVFDRYDITSTRDLQEAAERLTGIAGSVKVKRGVKRVAVLTCSGERARR